MCRPQVREQRVNGLIAAGDFTGVPAPGTGICRGHTDRQQQIRNQSDRDHACQKPSAEKAHASVEPRHQLNGSK